MIVPNQTITTKLRARINLTLFTPRTTEVISNLTVFAPATIGNVLRAAVAALPISIRVMPRIRSAYSHDEISCVNNLTFLLQDTTGIKSQ
jgi:hypothetical protein